MHQVLKELFPKMSFAILSGPNFAAEVIKGLPQQASYLQNLIKS